MTIQRKQERKLIYDKYYQKNLQQILTRKNN